MKKKIFTVARVGISILLLWLLFTRINIRELIAHYADIRLPFLLLGFFLLLCQVGMSAYKWRYILGDRGERISFPFLLKTYYIGMFLGLFLPSTVGGDVYRIYALRGENKDWGSSTSSVLFERLTGLTALLSISIVSGIFLASNGYNWLIVVLFLALLTGFLFMTSDFIWKKLAALSGNFRFKVLNLLQEVIASFRSYRNKPARLLVILLISFLFQLNVVFITKIYTLSLGMDVSFAHLLVIVPVIYLTDALPVSINGFGVRESAFAYFFVFIGRTKEEGLAVSLLTVFMRYFISSIGGLLLLGSHQGGKKEPAESVLVGRAGNKD